MLKRQLENTDWNSMLRDHMIVQPEKRIVYNPTITQPSAQSVWHAGQIHHVKWSTADMPDQARNYTGIVKLGYLPANGDGGENLHWTLANDFPIAAGIVEIKLPDDLQPRSDYIIVLMGDSGNASPKFTIGAKLAAQPDAQLDAQINAQLNVDAD